MKTRLAAASLLAFMTITACGRETPPPPPPEPPPECAAAWNLPASSELVDQLVQATAVDHAVWTDYDVGDGSYVLNAGPSSDSTGACLGLWHGGRTISYTWSADEPSLLTPLYGYYFDRGWQGGTDADLVMASAQPGAVTEWLEANGVNTAIVLPIMVANFPIELTPLFKVQLMMHEAFHVDVQAPRWFAGTGNWPDWEHQPDRPGLQACYTANADVISALEAEREHLVSLIEHLLDGDSAKACEACRAFREQRLARYAMLANVRVALHDSTPGTCAEAEAIVELEEGTADYASWTVLYDLGLASRESLIRRYRASQNDVFYMTGAMQLHAVQLLYPDSTADLWARIAQSRGPDDGSPTAVLTRALSSFCPRDSEGNGGG